MTNTETLKKAFETAIRFKWNWLLLLGIILAVITLFRQEEETAALSSIFWGSWLIVHRIIIAFKNEQLKEIYNRNNNFRE